MFVNVEDTTVVDLVASPPARVFSSTPTEVDHHIRKHLLLELDRCGTILLVYFQFLLVSLRNGLLVV